MVVLAADVAAVVAAVVAPAAAVGVCVVVPHAERTMATKTIILTSLKVRIYFLLQICLLAITMICKPVLKLPGAGYYPNLITVKISIYEQPPPFKGIQQYQPNVIEVNCPGKAIIHCR
jgi:hypothetical protein